MGQWLLSNRRMIAMNIEQLIINCILYVIVPLWLLAGIGDWYLHRRSSIETTSGWRESALHSLMLAEMGVAVLACLFLEINGAVFILLGFVFLVHEFTALWDVSYTQSRRYIAPIEQHIHSFLEMIPLMILLLLTLLHWSDLVSLVRNDASQTLAFEWKALPLDTGYLIAVLFAVVTLQIVPYAEELWRCRTVKTYHPTAQESDLTREV